MRLLLCTLALCAWAELLAAADGCYFEIEQVPPEGRWIAASDFDGYKGSGYYSWTGPYDKSPSAEDTIDYTIAFPEDGVYRIEIRGRRDRDYYQCDLDAASDHCNDMYTRMDGGKWVKTMMKRPQYGDDDGGSGGWSNWMWDGRRADNGNPEWTVSAGEHVFSICGRSEGVSIDAVRIYRDGTEKPDASWDSWLVTTQRQIRLRVDGRPLSDWVVEEENTGRRVDLIDNEALIDDLATNDDHHLIFLAPDNG